MLKNLKGEIVLKKRVLSGLLAIALIFGSAAALPEGVFETSSTIRASADSYVYGDFLYDLSENGKYVMITKYLDKTSTTCPIPETIDGKPVEIIAHAAFRDHTELEKVVFPKSLRGIANVAFKGCTSLRELDLPETLTQISESAFEGCTYLESVTIPKGVKTIGKNAFASCECLDSVTIQDGVGGIGVGAFSGCSWLSNITIPGSVKTIAVNAFNKCINLERVTISDGVEFIGAYAFTGCPCLSRLVIPKSVKTIGKDNTAYPYSEDNPICDKDKCSIACYPGSNALTYAAFNGYKIEYISGDYIYKELKDDTVEITGYLGKDKALTIPSELAEKKVSGIGNGAFANMSDLTSVTIPKGVKSIGNNAFALCKSLKSITIPSSVTSIGDSAFRYCWRLTSVTIPNSVTTIGNSAFADCDSLTSVTIPSSVRRFGEFAFGACHKLESAVIPTGVETITYDLFAECRGLKSVTIPSSVKSIESGAFAGCSSLKSITIPKSVTSIDHVALGYDYDDDHMLMVNPDFIVRCYKDSAAEKYAKDNNLKIEYITAKHVAAKKATCTTDGNIEYWKYGNKYYSDKELTKQIDESKIVIKATGHKYGEPTWTWDGVKGATAKFVCGNNSKHVETFTAKITSNTTKAATCTSDGKAVYTATVPFNGKTYTNTNTVTIPKTGHNWSKWTTTKAATCTADGEQTRTCSVCKKTETAAIAKLRHDYKATVVKPTCTKQGYTLHKCSRCGDSYKDTYKDATGHNWSKWTTTKAATCTADGSKTRTCSVCKKTETATITKLGHDYKATVVKPTCTAKGYTLHKCSRCGDSYKDTYKDATGHSWSKWTTTKKATCTADGSKTRTCSVCKKTETATIAKLGHDYVTTVVKPTCTAKGYTLHKCSRCGDSYKDTYKDATGHKWSKWTTTKKATCTADGVQTRKCTVCGKTETKTIKATGHKLTATPAKAATCTTNGNKAYWYCSTCKKYFSDKNGKTEITKASTVVKAAGHKFTAWKTTSYNVDNGTSTQKRTCSVCKKTETRPVNNAVVRYAGANRYDTAAMLSKASHKTTSDTVIIADAMTFQDALIAVPLAKAYNAPLLLANPNIVTKQTEAELARLKAKKVIIVNTSNALKSGTINALKNKYTTQIIRGNNCFETSKRVAEELQKKTKKAPTDVFFTTNKAFADALSISPVAALKGAPILYVDPSKKTLDSNILAYLNKVKGSIKNVYIVGGTVAVPKAIENSIKKALPKKNVTRFDGAQRYETCVMINNYFASLLNSKTVCVAKGLDFPDALAGGVFAANQKAPLLLADSALRDAHKSFLKDKKPNKLYIFGGTVAVPDKLAKEVAKMSV